MEEGDVKTFGTLARSLVDEAATFLLCLGQSVGHTVGNGESHMLNAAAATVVGDEFGDSAVVGSAFEQFDFGLTNLEECGFHLLVGNFLDGKTFKAENLLVERDRSPMLWNGNADVFDMGNFHNCVFIGFRVKNSIFV